MISAILSYHVQKKTLARTAMKLLFTTLFIISLGATSACTRTFDLSGKSTSENPQSPKAESAKVELIPIGTVKPELDFSNEVPDCETAAQRIRDNVTEGMVLADIRRLVGKPRAALPGSWWWSSGFGSTGRPFVRFGFGTGDDTVPVTSFGGGDAGC